MGLLKFFGALSPAHINWVTWSSGATLAGADQEGNRYFRAKVRKGYKRERRWVLYNGEAEASRVPPEWHGWLHHQTNALPSNENMSFRREWQKPHKRNLTGALDAYRPPGHILKGGKRDKATGDYESWRPPE
jgi:NADH:ubiquinone oxidoreductase subunit